MPFIGRVTSPAFKKSVDAAVVRLEAGSAAWYFNVDLFICIAQVGLTDLAACLTSSFGSKAGPNGISI